MEINIILVYQSVYSWLCYCNKSPRVFVSYSKAHTTCQGYAHYNHLGTWAKDVLPRLPYSCQRKYVVATMSCGCYKRVK